MRSTIINIGNVSLKIFLIMTDSKENLKQTETKLVKSQNELNKSSQKPKKKRERLKFEEKDMIKIKYNF